MPNIKAAKKAAAKKKAVDAKNRAFGQHLKALIKRSGFSTSEMAEHCHVSAGAVSNWYATGTISKENLVAVARKLSTTSDDIVLSAPGDGASMAPPPPTNHVSTEPVKVEARRTYSLEALELAWTYDHLPSDFARARAQALLANLEAENPLLMPAPPKAPRVPRVKTAKPARAKRKPSAVPRRSPSAKAT